MLTNLDHIHTKLSFSGDTSIASVNLLSTAVMQNVIMVLNDGTLCKNLISTAHSNNVTNLITVTNIQRIGDVCHQTPKFATIFVPGPLTQPSSLPTGQPSSAPTGHPQSKIITANFIGFITIVILISFFRLIPSIVDLFTERIVMKRGHMYDILVVLNNDEHAVLENIRHEDIAFYRRIETENDYQSTSWLMNVTSNILEIRFEVEFFDTYDLLGQNKRDEADIISSKDDEIVGNKVIKQSIYAHDAALCMGMIIRVKPSRDHDVKGSDDLYTNTGDDGMEHYPAILLKIKPAVHSTHVLKQLPHCYKTRTHYEDEINGINESHKRLPLVCMSAYSEFDDGISDSSDDDVIPFHTNAPIFGEKPTPNNHFLKDFESDCEGSVESLSLDLYMKNFGDRTSRSNAADEERQQSASNGSRRRNINLLQIQEKTTSGQFVSKDTSSIPSGSPPVKTSRSDREQSFALRTFASEKLKPKFRTRPRSQNGSWKMREKGGVESPSFRTWSSRNKIRPQPQPIVVLEKSRLSAWKGDEASWKSNGSDKNGAKNKENMPNSDSDESESNENGKMNFDNRGEEKDSYFSDESNDVDEECEEEKDDESEDGRHFPMHYNHYDEDMKYDLRHVMTEEKEAWL